MDNWTPLYIGMGILAVIGIASGIFANPIKKAIKHVEYLADGKVTDHHKYIPYD